MSDGQLARRRTVLPDAANTVHQMFTDENYRLRYALEALANRTSWLGRLSGLNKLEGGSGKLCASQL
jgi:hypothetical protein